MLGSHAPAWEREMSSSARSGSGCYKKRTDFIRAGIVRWLEPGKSRRQLEQQREELPVGES